MTLCNINTDKFQLGLLLHESEIFSLMLILLAVDVGADNSTLDAAIGGAIGEGAEL